jgi:hypothetical protein
MSNGRKMKRRTEDAPVRGEVDREDVTRVTRQDHRCSTGSKVPYSGDSVETAARGKEARSVTAFLTGRGT